LGFIDVLHGGRVGKADRTLKWRLGRFTLTLLRIPAYAPRA